MCGLLCSVFAYFGDCLFGEFGVDHYSAAVFADNHFFVHLDFYLLLRRDSVEAASACIAVHDNHTEAVAGIAADALECLEEAFVVDQRLEFLGAYLEVLFLGAGLANDVFESGFSFL